MNIAFKRLRAGAMLPQQATAQSAGYDLCALLEKPLTIAPGQIAKIPTGLACAPDRADIALCIFPRSGLAAKHGVTLVNSIGLVDSDYRGEWFIPLINHGTEPFTVENRMRIAQLVAMPIYLPQIIEVQTLPGTDRGSGGFGSTGLGA